MSSTSRRTRISRVTITAFVLAFAACAEDPIAPPSEATPDPDPVELRVQDGLPALAAGISRALGSPDVRSDILAAMRRSHRVEHGLLLRPYLGSPLGAKLLAASAQTLGTTEAELLARVETLGELEVSAPFREHRLTWTGTERVAVAASMSSDEERLVAHEPSGLRRSVSQEEAQEYDAFFFIRPRESFGTRIGRQADVPGPVIQDPDDGERAAIGTWTNGEESFSVDYGSFDSEEALQAYIDSRLASLFGPPRAADCLASATSQDCGTGPGRGPGQLPPVTAPSPTTLESFTLLWDTELGTEEVEITVGFGHHYRTQRYEGVHHNQRFVPSRLILARSPQPGGTGFFVDAVETDLFRDDDLGYAAFGYREGGISLGLNHIDISLIW